MARSILGGNALPVAIVGMDAEGLAGASGAATITTKEAWTPKLQASELTNQSSQTYTVPAGKLWQVLMAWAELTSDATAGNRQLEFRVLDNNDEVLLAIQAGATQAASLTRNYAFAPGLADLTAFRDTSFLMTPVPPTVILTAGYKIRIGDNKSISVGDDLNVRMLIAERDA